MKNVKIRTMKAKIDIPARYNYVAYPHEKKGLFRGATGEVEEKNIVGSSDDCYIYRFIKSETEGGKTVAPYLSPIGIHKTRLIKWLPTQLEMF